MAIAAHGISYTWSSAPQIDAAIADEWLMPTYQLKLPMGPAADERVNRVTQCGRDRPTER